MDAAKWAAIFKKLFLFVLFKIGEFVVYYGPNPQYLWLCELFYFILFSFFQTNSVPLSIVKVFMSIDNLGHDYLHHKLFGIFK